MTADKFTYWGWDVVIYRSTIQTYLADATKGDRCIMLDIMTINDARVEIKKRIEKRENSFRKEDQ